MGDVKGNVICIIGMHRSGTSMIARLLKDCGLYLGPDEQLLGAHYGNPEGHFEHTEFMNIDDALLRHLGGSWEFPPEPDPGWEKDASLDELRSKARSFLETFSGRSPWGWKGPRTTILLPFWKSLVPNLRFVICVRSPLEVAESLAKRNKIAAERGFFLWYRYLRAAIEDTAGYPRMITFYDDFFIEAAAELQWLIAFCGLEKPADSSAIADGIRGELRHHRSPIAEILGATSLAAEYKLLYLGLRGLRGGEAASRSPENDTANHAGEVLRVLDEFHDRERLAQLQTELTKKEYELSKLRSQILNDAKANHRWAYRVYQNLIKPFRLRRP